MKAAKKAKPATKIVASKSSAKVTTKSKSATKPTRKSSAKTTAKTTTKSKPAPASWSTVLAAANKLRDHGARAKYLEAQLLHVIKPVKLVDPLCTALFELGGNDAVGRTLLAIATHDDLSRVRDRVALLEVLGEALDSYWCEGEAIDVLRLAITAGSRSESTVEMLGGLLARRGDPQCVELLERAIEADPDHEPPRLSLALYFLERDPARALEPLSVVASGEAADLRAMVHAATGRAGAAKAAEVATLQHYESPLEAHRELCEWHSNENRYDRALVHARALLQLRTTAKRISAARRDAIDVVIVHAFHRGRAFGDLVPWVTERCAQAVPAAMAWDVFHGLTSLTPNPHPELASRAAEACAAEDPSEAQVWRVRIAGIRSTDADTSALAALATDGLNNDAAAWVELANEYHRFEASDAASAAVDRALELDPSSVGALTAMFDLAKRAGDLALMERAARAVAAAEPYGHEGAERLGRMLLRRGEGAPALELAEQAVKVAPYCHNAWLGLGEARLVVGDLERARAAATRSAEISAPEAGCDTALLLAALSGDPEKLEAELAAQHRHLSMPPFPAFIAALRTACAGSRS